MKRRYTLFLLLFVAVSASAQVETSHVNIQKQEEMLKVRFTATIGKKTTTKNYKLILTPVLYKEEESQKIKPIIVETRRTRIIDTRNGIAPAKEAYLTGNGRQIEYSFSLPYEKWMNGAALRMDRLSCGCCDEKGLQPILIAGATTLVEEAVSVVENQVVPAPPTKQIARQWLFTKKEMTIDFGLNKAEITDSLFGNQQILKEITESIEKIRRQSNSVLTKIEIIGYASPEGREDRNRTLAEKRAAALKSHVQSRIANLPDSLFAVQNGGENWQGLRAVVAASEMQHREEILRIIDNVPVEVINQYSRKKQLMDLRSGRPYRYMAEKFFPKLRNACYIAIYYDTEDTEQIQK